MFEGVRGVSFTVSLVNNYFILMDYVVPRQNILDPFRFLIWV